MTIPADSLVERLLAAGNPAELVDWESKDGYYVATCRVSPADVSGLIEVVRRWNDPDWMDTIEPDVDEPDSELLPVTAWRALADLKSDSAVGPLVEILCQVTDELDDWASDELPHVFGKIGEASIEPLRGVATDGGKPEFIRSIAASGLRWVASYHPDTRDGVIAELTSMMANAGADDVQFNSTVLAELFELHAVEAAEPIERAFAGNRVDVSVVGDWEYVRSKWGVEGLGLAMPENPHNVIKRLRSQLGAGIFSNGPVFLYGDLHPEGVKAYFERAYALFSESSEGQEARERYGPLRWYQSLLEFGLRHLGEVVDELSLGGVREYLLSYLPRKVSVDASSAPAIIGELTLFWQYLDRVFRLPAAKAIVAWLESDDLTARLEAELSDSDNFGMAKSIVMMGANAGYDMTSEAGFAQFTADYNRSLQAPPPPAPSPLAPPPRIVSSRRVGRNDPCLCGSGKKFKKCCGGPS